MLYLGSKIFHRFPIVNSVVKLQIEFGTPKSQINWLLLPFSIYTWNLAPESAYGAKLFRVGVILGHPNVHMSEYFVYFLVIW